MDAGPDDAAERVVNNRHVGSGLGDVRMRRRGVHSGGAGLLCDGAEMAMRVMLRTDGAGDAFWAWVSAYVHPIKLGPIRRHRTEYGMRGKDALLDRQQVA